MKTQAHEVFMRRAIELAHQGEGLTRPNPPVGAVVVKGGKIVGEGFHKKAGEDHAEVIALKSAGKKGRGSTLYVTLEPCSTKGRTPPCVDRILEAGVKRVVLAVRDPNPEHNGRGARLLRSKGIEVVSGVCGDEATDLLAPFSKWITSKRPYVTLKLGMTLDGKIADAKGKSRWITGVKSRAKVHALRRRVDAIMVGHTTAAKDNPNLQPVPPKGRKPYRVVVSSTGKLPSSLKILNDEMAELSIIATTNKCKGKVRKRLEEKGVQIWNLPESRTRVSLPRLMDHLGARGIMHVLCEGGGELAEALIKGGLVDEYLIFVGGSIIGGKDSHDAIGGSGWSMDSKPELKFLSVCMLGNDLEIRAKPKT